MARRALVELVGDGVSLQRALERSAAAAAAFDGEIKKLAVDTEASTRAIVSGSAARQARLEQEAAAARGLGASYAFGSREQIAAQNLELRKLEQLARLQGTAGLTAADAAKLQVASTVRQTEALDAQIGAYRRLATAAGTTAREQQIASRFATEATAQQAALLGAGAARRGLGRAEVAGRVGRGLTTFVTAPAAFIGFEAVKGAIDFNQQMLLIRTQAGDAEDSIKGLSGQVLNLAHVAPQGPSELAKGLFHLTSLGLRGSQAMGVLKVSSFAAGMGIANLEDVTTALGGVVVAGIKGAQNYQQAMATLVGTAGAGNMRMEDLAGAIGNVTPAAAASGVSLSEMGAGLAVMTDRGMNADEAATRLRMTLALIQRPSDKAKKALKDMGIDADSLGGILRQPGGLLKVLQILHDGIDKVGKTRGNRDLLAAFGGGRSGLGAQTLVGSLDSPLSSFQGKLQLIEEGQRRFAANQKLYLESPAYKLHAAWSTIQADLVKLGNTFAPVAVKAAQTMGKVADGFDHLPKFVKRDIGVIVGILGVGGPLLLGVSKAAKMVKTLGAAFRLLPITAGPAIATTDAELATVGTTATTAGLKVGALRGALLGLGRLGAIGVVIELILHKGQVDSFLSKHHAGFLNKGLIGDVNDLKKHLPHILGGTGGHDEEPTPLGGGDFRNAKLFGPSPNVNIRGTDAAGRPTTTTKPPAVTSPHRRGITAAQRNEFFDSALGRELNRVTDLGQKQQLSALDRIGAQIEAQIGKTHDITRKLTLRDKLLEVMRERKGVVKDMRDHAQELRKDAREHAETARKDALDLAFGKLGLSVDKAGLSARLGDDLAALNAEKGFIQKQIASGKDVLHWQQELVGVEGQIASLRQQQADKRKESLDKLAQRRDDVRGQIGDLFSGPVLNPSEDQRKRLLGVPGPDAKKLTADLKGQVAQFKSFQHDLGVLKSRGASGQLIKELKAEGLTAAPQVHALATANKATLGQYFAAFGERESLVKSTAMNAKLVNVRADKVLVGGAGSFATDARGRGGITIEHVDVHGVQDPRKFLAEVQRIARSQAPQRGGRHGGQNLGAS